MLLRIGLTSFISGKDDLQCVGEADSGRTAVELTHKLKPDVVIMDLMMPEMSGAEATKLIHGKLPTTRIVVLTSYGTSKELAEAIANGASAALQHRHRQGFRHHGKGTITTSPSIMVN